MLNVLILSLIAFCVSLLVTPIIRNAALHFGVVDKPGGRKIHRLPVPRLGGISLILSMFVTILMAHELEWISGDRFAFVFEMSSGMICGIITIFLVGLYDDLRPAPAWMKLLFQFGAAGIVVYSGVRFDVTSPLGQGTIDLGLFAVPVTVLWIIVVTNAFNLIDGLDGLAAGLGIIAAITTATIFGFLGATLSDSAPLLILAGALAGFLRYNFYPASIFLGDSGSQVIGFTLAILSIAESQKIGRALPAVIPLLIFGLPLLDILLSMVRRALKTGELQNQRSISPMRWVHSSMRMFESDRDHVHHRLLTMGLTHPAAVLMLYALASGLSLLAIIAVIADYRNAGAILLIVFLVAYVGICKLGYDEITLVRIRALLQWGERVMLTRLTSLATLDLTLIAIAYWLTFILKYEGIWSSASLNWYLQMFPLVSIIQFSVFLGFGLYRGIWRAMGSSDLLPLSQAVAFAVLFSHVAAVIQKPPSGIGSFFALNWVVLQVLVLAGRRAIVLLAQLHRRGPLPKAVGVLIYGAGRRGESVLRELRDNRGLDLCPAGFVDDDPTLVGLKINGVSVLGSTHDLSSIISTQKVSAIIISTPKIPSDRLISVAKLCSEQRIPVLRCDFQLERLTNLGRVAP